MCYPASQSVQLDQVKFLSLVLKAILSLQSPTPRQFAPHYPPLLSINMPPKPPSTGKRKDPPTSTTTPNRSRKRAKTQDARSIAVQSSGAALSKTGELDVSSFVQAREYE